MRSATDGTRSSLMRRAALAEHGPRASDEGRVLAIENHQDFGSDELVAFCETTRGVGICFDTGNTFPVAEAPLDFTRRIAAHVRHVHLKDYRVQFTDEGYRLVRCAIGDGAVPLPAMLDLLAAHNQRLTAVLEPGALEARHVRLCGRNGGASIRRNRRRRLPPAWPPRASIALPDEADYSHALGARRGCRNRRLRTRHDPPQRRQHARNWPRAAAKGGDA